MVNNKGTSKQVKGFEGDRRGRSPVGLRKPLVTKWPISLEKPFAP